MTHSSDELSTVPVAEKHVSTLICGQQKTAIIDVSDHPAASDKQHLSGVITVQIKNSTQSYYRQSDSLFKPSCDVFDFEVSETKSPRSIFLIE